MATNDHPSSAPMPRKGQKGWRTRLRCQLARRRQAFPKFRQWRRCAWKCISSQVWFLRQGEKTIAKFNKTARKLFLARYFIKRKVFSRKYKIRFTHILRITTRHKKGSRFLSRAHEPSRTIAHWKSLLKIVLPRQRDADRGLDSSGTLEPAGIMMIAGFTA